MAEERRVLLELGTIGTLKKVEVPVELHNRKCTEWSVRPITEIAESEFNGRKYLWPNGSGAYCKASLDVRGKGYVKNAALVAETDAPYLLIDYESGSWKNVYHSFIGLWDVSAGEWVFLLGREGVEDVNRERYEDAKRRLVEAGYALSRSRPVSNAAAFLILEREGRSSEPEGDGEARELAERLVNLVGPDRAVELVLECAGKA